ncbi:hypothetical protein [Pseudomonas monteilii]|uniref:hypothetical protein n=1 Tax=Pseudomonas monteilii TaxID=76759 RepID=UPI001E3A18B7|nr:hypothetical protein [Pseudomonas monteilii]WJO30732.1 hypothetical protein LU690_16665 [Pseudomonas monteilii]WMM94792.1 hypothetical protein [Pseudomonas monteilii]
MQKLILLALVVIIVLIAPWTLGLLAIGGAAWAIFAIVAGVVVIAFQLWLNYSTDLGRQQKRLEKRIQRMTAEANRANAKKD